MIRATSGIWVNYATTALFQVVFAAKYGTGTRASAFVITFGIAYAAASVLVTAVQAIVVPRLIAPGGELLSRPLRLLAWVCGASIVLLGLLAVLASPIAHALGPTVHIDPAQLVSPLRFAAVFALLQVAVAGVTAIVLARGSRFLPAAAPALPSIAAAVVLLAVGHASLTALYSGLLIGSALELVLLVPAIGRPGIMAGGGGAGLRATTLGTLGALGLLNLIAPLERIVASAHSADGAAQYNYAIRSLAVVQQLLIGGAMLSALGDWSDLVRTAQERVMRRSLVRTTIIAALLLTFAASIAVTSSDQLVAAVYQHGAFTHHDTRAVAALLLLCLPGFWADGVGLILSQALLAWRRNGIAIWIGVFRFVLQASLMLWFGHMWGARGVALAYSASLVAVLAVQVVAVSALALIRRSDVRPAVNGLFVGLGTIGAAAACELVGGSIGVGAKIGVVTVIFGVLVMALRPFRGRMILHV